MERWVPLLGYPGYSISDLGRVRNDKRDHVLTPVVLEKKRSYVCLTLDGAQVKRGLSKLVCETFVQKPARRNFTTPIHLDGDLSNCQANNLDWRPRWFAIKHAEQFRKDLPEYRRPVRLIETREVFDEPWLPVFQFGLLYMDLLLSIFNKTYVFPTMHSYEWA